MANATARNVDFTNVKDGGNFNRNRIPSGDYLAVVTKVEDAESKKDGVAQYLFSIKLVKRPSSVFPYYCKLQENQLWKLRNIAIAGGISVPKRRMKFDPNRLVGKQIGVTIADAEFEGKEQSEIDGIFPAAELADDNGAPIDEDDETPEEAEEEPEDEPEEEPEEAADEEEPEAEEEEDENPYAGLDRTALKAELKKRDATFQAKKSQTDEDLIALLIEQDAAAAGNGDPIADEEDEEEEPEEAPAPVAKKRGRPAGSTTKKPAAEVSDEELEELDIDAL